MPAKSAFVPKYCLHKPSGKAYVRIHGKVIYTGDYGTAESKAEYGRLISELAASNGAAVSDAPTSALTIVELCATYLDFARGYYQKDGLPTRTIQGILAAIRTLKNLYGKTLVAEFGPLALLAIQTKLATDQLSRGYVNKQVSYIKRIFKWGVSRSLVPPTVYTALATVEGLRMGRTAARESKPVPPVSDELVEATMPYLPAVVAAMIRFQRLTGCRPGEVCQLRPCDVTRTGDVWEYRPHSHKTQHLGRDRVIFIGPKAQTVLLPYLSRAQDAYCFSPADSVENRHTEMRQRRKTPLQPSQKCRRKRKPKSKPGKIYRRQSYSQAIARAVIRANKDREKEAADMGIKPILLPHWHANQLRHSKATEVRREFGLEAAQVSLGHAKADTTEIYAERDARLAVEVAKKIG